MEKLFSIFCPAILSFLVIILVLSTYFILWKTKPQSSNQPPKLPLIGNLHQLICKLPHRRLAQLAQIYGPFMQLQLGQVSAMVVSSPEVAKQLLKDNDIKFSNRSRVSVADILFYKCQDIAFAPYGEYWRQMRKICMLEVLSSKRVQSFRSIREEEISNLIRSINSKVRSPINLSEMTLSLTNTIVARTVIGRKNNNEQAVLDVTNRIVKAAAGFTVLDMFPYLEFIHVITGMKSRLLKLYKVADQIFEDIIKQHKQQELNGEADNLLTVLLELQAIPDSLLTTDGIKATILDMFIGGTDTCAAVLEWAMSELMKNPRVMKKKKDVSWRSVGYCKPRPCFSKTTVLFRLETS
ncbi:cytochrome P450 726A27-like isoform X2 [Euphorbia lathyris]|uniref:cytochrome P450 726A27-like isoform X2 n=1 Tax=Euphorbia lathyris TaxID=212925 RepID=UPI003314291F